MTNPVTPEGRAYSPGEQVPAVAELLVTPAYFRTFGIPLRAGRAFSEDDRDGAPPVAIVSETMARRFYSGQALGRWIQTGEPDPDSPRLTIVGVVGDVKYTGLDASPEAALYVPYAQQLWWRTIYVSVRGPGDGTALVRTAHAALATRAADTLLFDVRATDPATFVCMAALLLGVLLLACWLPAWRVARTDPVVALRGD